MTYFDDLGMDRELLLNFFLRFSRFEFALKAAGYAVGNETRVDPNWTDFARDITADFDRVHSPELDDACDFFLTNPPHKQVLVNGQLAWSGQLPNEQDGEVALLLSLVRRVRNNLFHGGKYNAGLHDEPARNTRLLHSGLLVLDECLRTSDRVRRYYDGSAI